MSKIVGQLDDMDIYLKDSIEEQRNLPYLLSCEDRMKNILILTKYILFIFVSCVFCWNLVFNLTFNKAIVNYFSMPQLFKGTNRTLNI